MLQVCRGFSAPPGFRPESLSALLAGAVVTHEAQQEEMQVRRSYIMQPVGHCA